MSYQNKYELYMILKEDGIFIEGPRGNKIISNAPSPSIKIGGDKLFSGRGFVWSRTLPLLKNTILLGNGPDTFPAYFPQNDIVGKLNAFYNIRPIIFNPHNMYIQTTLSGGVIALIALLISFFFYVKSSIKAFNKTENMDFIKITGAACFCGFLSFCITGFVNDSTVFVSPLFWVLFGIGIAMNKTIKIQSR